MEPSPSLRRRALHKRRIFAEFTLSLSYTSSRAATRRGDPGSLDLPLGGTKAWEYYIGFVAYAPRNDELRKDLL